MDDSAATTEFRVFDAAGALEVWSTQDGYVYVPKGNKTVCIGAVFFHFSVSPDSNLNLNSNFNFNS